MLQGMSHIAGWEKMTLDREAPGLTSSSKQGLFPQTRLRNLQPELPDILTAATLARIEQALAALK